MSQKRANWVLLFLFLCVPLYGKVNGPGDYQAWLINSTKLKLSKRTSLYIENEERWADQITLLWLTYTQLRYGFQLTKTLEIAPGYRQQWNLIEGDWKTLYNPLVDLIWSKEFGRWKLWDRSRIQYFVNPAIKNTWFYRNYMQVFLNLKHFSPFVGNEFFFIERLGFAENRTYFGAKLPVGGKMHCNLYYQIRFIKPEQWIRTTVFGGFFTINY